MFFSTVCQNVVSVPSISHDVVSLPSTTMPGYVPISSQFDKNLTFCSKCQGMLFLSAKICILLYISVSFWSPLPFIVRICSLHLCQDMFITFICLSKICTYLLSSSVRIFLLLYRKYVLSSVYLCAYNFFYSVCQDVFCVPSLCQGYVLHSHLSVKYALKPSPYIC
jgi:hypothetical protein